MQNTDLIFPLIIQEAAEAAKGLSYTTVIILFAVIFLINFITLVILLLFRIPKVFTKKIISTSLKVALNRKAHTTSFLRFLFSSSIASGIIIALIVFSLANDIMRYNNSSNILITIICGLVSGILSAGIILYFIRKITHSVKKTIGRHVSKIGNQIKRH